MPSSQFVIMSRTPSPDGQMSPLGSRAEILERLSGHNTAPERPDQDLLYGPGLELHLPPGQDPVLQMLMNVSDHDIAWIAVLEMARELGWKILDPQTGRDFAP